MRADQTGIKGTARIVYLSPLSYVRNPGHSLNLARGLLLLETSR